MPSIKNIQVGDRFGRCVVVEVGLRVTPSPSTARAGAAGYGVPACLVACECGTTKTVRARRLVVGRTRSCGCRQRLTDGRASHPRYKAWEAMIRRCVNPKDKAYPNYGGRGITVYPAWRDAGVFLDWLDRNLGPRPDGHSLDRIDNDGNYEPGNVRWADAATQNTNRRPRVRSRHG